MRLLGRVLTIILALVGMLTLLTAGLGLWVAGNAGPAPLPDHMALSLDLDRGLIEERSDSPFSLLDDRQPYTVREIVAALDRAADDPRVASLVARIDGGRIGMAEAQEVRDAVLAFRKSGKRAIVYSSSLGDVGNATIPYYLASAFQEIWLQPSGEVGVTGFMAESPFLKGTLDMLEIKPQFGARYEYKSAIDVFTQSKFTKENRASLQLLLDSWYKQAVSGIAEGRKLTPDQVKALIDKGPLLAEEAKSGGLIDRLAYWDELEKAVTAGGVKEVDLDDYRARLKPEPNAVKVALITGVGAVQQDDEDNPLSGDAVMSSNRLAKAFAEAAKDPAVKAILFRIDSPGGSYTAADAIWRSVAVARAAGKPVVASMGDVAASGGYFAAMGADSIVAEPGTITGSIGVFSGKMVLSDFLKKLGVTFDEVHDGQNAPIWSSNSAFSDSGWARMNAILDHIYADFTGKAAAGRHIRIEDMDALARGRIWPGDLAKDRHLIDANGGYETAMGEIRRLARLPSQMPLDLVPFPRPKSRFEILMRMAETGRLPRELALAGAGARLAELAGPLVGLLEQKPGALIMPPLTVR